MNKSNLLIETTRGNKDSLVCSSIVERDHIRFFRKIGLLLLPIALLFGAEIFLFPIDAFTFRAWEALHGGRAYFVLPGPFYIEKRLKKIEQGDLAPHTVYSVAKPVLWETDEYGYRAPALSSEHPELVIIGDSVVAGSGLSQEETIGSRFFQKSKIPTYLYAPSSLNRFLLDQRFEAVPPRVIVFSQIERSLQTPLWPVMEVPPFWRHLFWRLVTTKHWIQAVEILNRLYKANMLNFIRARVDRLYASPLPPMYWHNGQELLFLQGPGAIARVPRETTDGFVQSLKPYKEFFEARGIRFIFMPIPDKETVYYEFLHGGAEPTFFNELIAASQKEGIETLNVLPAFYQHVRSGSPLLYHVDDTHWNGAGVRLTADLLAQMVGKHR